LIKPERSLLIPIKNILLKFLRLVIELGILRIGLLLISRLPRDDKFPMDSGSMLNKLSPSPRSLTEVSFPIRVLILIIAQRNLGSALFYYAAILIVLDFVDFLLIRVFFLVDYTRHLDIQGVQSL